MKRLVLLATVGIVVVSMWVASGLSVGSAQEDTAAVQLLYEMSARLPLQERGHNLLARRRRRL